MTIFRDPPTDSFIQTDKKKRYPSNVKPPPLWPWDVADQLAEVFAQIDEMRQRRSEQ
jgi:hypothetical protein